MKTLYTKKARILDYCLVSEIVNYSCRGKSQIVLGQLQNEIVNTSQQF